MVRCPCNPLFDRSTCDDLGGRAGGCMVSGMKLKLMEAWVVCDTQGGLCLCPRCYKQKYVGEKVDHHGFGWEK